MAGRRLRPGSARALGVRTALADRLLLAAVAVAVVVSLDAVGALLVAVVLVVPAATVRLVARDVRSLQLGTAVLAAAEGVTALLVADALDVGPGPVMAVLGGVVFAARGGGAAMTLVRRGRARRGGYVPGRDALDGVSFALDGGQIAGVLGPNGGGKTTLFRALLGELPAAARHRRAARAPRLRARRPTTRGWTSRSARSTSR